VAVKDIVPVPGERFEDTLAAASPDLLREMIKSFAQQVMDAEVEALCGAGYGEMSLGAGELPQRVPAAGVGHPGRDGGAGDPEAAAGSYYPEWLLERRRRAERALATVVATSYLLGVSTRRAPIA
jgi:putative transposase